MKKKFKPKLTREEYEKLMGHSIGSLLNQSTHTVNGQ